MKPVPLQFGKYYHIYSRGNNRESIFREERNYPYFLALYARHVAPIVNTYSYCLLRNHFHLLVQVKDEVDLTGFRNPSGLAVSPSQRVSNFLNAYAKAINKAYGRTGALFQRPFGRIEVISEAHLLHLVVYTHRNPQKHRFVTDFREWPYSSYGALLSTDPTGLTRDEVLGWFGGRDHFEKAHQFEADLAGLQGLPDLIDWDED